MSARWSTTSPATCSGAMYPGVPSEEPGLVMVFVFPAFSRAASMAFAMPKSETTAVPPDRRMLSGLMSRCTMPAPCA